jgi:hypothetical protein
MKTRQKKTAESKKWSKEVTKKSNALDLEAGVFTLSPKQMALSLMRSAENSQRRKAASPFQSAMAMLTFYQNRAGKKLSASKNETLQKAKGELRKLYGRPSGKKKTSRVNR